ncbi:MAG: hypothetical protein ACLFPQ_04130 [Candidatus Woesearchaeota archaeon]
MSVKKIFTEQKITDSYRIRKVFRRSFVLVAFIIMSIFFASFSLAATVRQSTTESVQSEFKQGEPIDIRDRETIRIFDQLLRFSILASGEKVYVRDMNADDFISLEKGECDLIGTTRVCHESGSKAMITARIYTMVPDVEIEQFLLKEEIIVGEENRMRIEISNEGLMPCNNCSYNEIIDEDIEILNVRGAELAGEMLVWNGTIKGESVKDISYDFRALDSGDFNATANVVYFNYYDWLENTAVAEVKVDSWFDINTSIFPEEIYLGHKSIAAWNITNLKEDKKNISITEFILEIPETITLTDLPSGIFGYNLEKTEYLWAGKIPYGRTKEFWVEYIPNKLFEVKIPYEFSYMVEGGNESFKVKREIIIPVKNRDVKISTDINSSSIYNASKKHSFFVDIKNHDSEIGFSDVVLRVYNEHFDQEFDLGNLEKSGAKRSEVKIDLPTITGTREFPVNILIEYSSPTGDRFNATHETKFNIMPFDEISLWHNFSLINKSREWNLYDVKIYAKNHADIEIYNMTLNEMLSEELFVKGMTELEKISFKPGEEKEIHSYTLNVPVENRSLSYIHDISSVISYYAQGTLRETDFSEELEIKPDYSFSSEKSGIVDAARNFSTFPMILLFVVSVVLISGSVVLYRKKMEFGIPGINSIKVQEKNIEKKKKNIEQQEEEVRKEQSKIDYKIHVLKDFLDKTKTDIRKKMPVSEERKNLLERRKDDFLRQKKEIDDKIKALQEEEAKLMEKYNQLEAEKNSIQSEEDALNNKYAKMKDRLIQLKTDFDKMLNKENILEKAKTELNNEQLELMKRKDKLLDYGSVRIVNEKEDVVNEKIELEHEKNKIEEEISSLKAKKNKIMEEQDNIKKQKSELKSEMNLFDVDKETVEKSISFLKKENEKLKDILNDISFR